MAKAVAFAEVLNDGFKVYAQQVISNAKTLADELMKFGFDVVSNGTDNHLMLIDLSNKNISGKKAEIALERAGITVNKNMVPFDTKSPFVTSGIRIGTPAVTTRGMKENEMKRIAEIINTAVANAENESVLDSLVKNVKDLCSVFPLYKDIV